MGLSMGVVGDTGFGIGIRSCRLKVLLGFTIHHHHLSASTRSKNKTTLFAEFLEWVAALAW